MRLPKLLAASIATAIVIAGGSGFTTTAAAKPVPHPRSTFRAPAVRTVRSPLERGLTVGVSLADDLTSGSPASLSAWDSRAHSIGTQIVRMDVAWASVAPTEPADGSNPSSPGYDWSATDQRVAALADAGFRVMITVQTAPAWAEGTGKPATAANGSWQPNVTAFGQFATALARRYDGKYPNPTTPGSSLPRVTIWQPWNEPNLPLYLSPSWIKSGPRWIDEAAIQYRSMLDAFYASVKAVSSHNYVVAAGTAPYGDPAGTLARIPPVTFDQDLFCLNAHNKPTGSCRRRAEFNALDHHPYVSGMVGEGPTWHAALPADVSIPDLYKLRQVLQAATRAGTVAPVGGKDLWVTEVAWQSDPPQPTSMGVPIAKEGIWAEQALHVLWAQGVQTVLWFQLGDPAPSATGTSGQLDDGLYFNGGDPKPAALAFRFPFLTYRTTKSRVTAWGKAPHGGTLWIQQKYGSRWVSLLKLKVSAGQVFEAPCPLRGHGSFRAAVGGVYSLPWRQSA